MTWLGFYNLIAFRKYRSTFSCNVGKERFVHCIVNFTICYILVYFSECVQLLLKHDAPVKVKNGLGWTVLAEAVSYGNRPTSKSI